MKKSIQFFWEIVRRHQKLFSIPGNNKDEQMMSALRGLHQVDQRLSFHCGYRDDGLDFLVSAEGHYDLSDTVVAILDAAPVLSGWRVRPILESRALFGERDLDLFPDDENGDVLYRIAQRAGDLITPADVDFCHVFPSERQGKSFATALESDFDLEAEPYDGRNGYSWQVIATKRIIPSHRHITSTERRLGDLAITHEGSSDGWGFMSS